MRARLYLLVLTAATSIIVENSASALADTDAQQRIQQGVDIIKLACGTGSGKNRLELSGNADGSLMLKTLPSLAVAGKVAYSKQEAQGLIAALSDHINSETIALSSKQIDCMKPYVDRIFNILFPLNQNEFSLEDDIVSKDAGARRSAIRKAFESVHVFTIDLTPAKHTDNLSAQLESRFESYISSPVDFYSFDNGQFTGKTGLRGHVSGDSISFKNGGCSGSLKNIAGTWNFKGPVSCNSAAGIGTYSAEFSLR